MKIKCVRTTALSFSFIVAFASTVLGQDSKFFPIDEVRPGMKGIGKTVFEGTHIEEFSVEVLGVLKNFAPKQDMILVRLSGGPLERAGVIQGMSGSPVFIDGRLLGAVAFGFNFSKDPIAGVQPISQMVRILDQKETPRPLPASSALPAESPQAFINDLLERLMEKRPFEQYGIPQSFLDSNLALSSLRSAVLTPIQTPLALSGFSPLAIQQFSNFFTSLGLNPIQGGGTGSVAQMPDAANAKIEPGAAINVELVRGDISASANGTVTYVEGKKVYAFGHPFLSTGPTDLPMSTGYVISVLPNMASSFKIAVPLQMAGSFKEDRSTGIYGRTDEKPQMIPVDVTLRSSRNSVNHYKFEVVNDRFLTPFLMNFSIFNTIIASERALGEMTLELSGKIRLKDQQSVKIDNVFTGDMNGPVVASMATAAPISYLLASGYENVVIEGIDLDIVSTDRKRNAQLDRIVVDKTEVRPGETVTLSAYLRGPNGDEFTEKYPIQIPTGLPAGRIQFLVGDGMAVTTAELRRSPAGVPKDLGQLIKELNKLRKNDRLYVKIMSFEPGVVIRGEEMPSLPPSLLSVIHSDRTSSRSVASTRNSTIREYELPPSKYVVQGQRSLTLTVVP